MLLLPVLLLLLLPRDVIVMRQLTASATSFRRLIFPSRRLAAQATILLQSSREACPFFDRSTLRVVAAAARGRHYVFRPSMTITATTPRGGFRVAAAEAKFP